jgi:hydrogenase/urease accessory protein HupE
MHYELRLHRILLSILISLLSVFVFFLFYIGSNIADERIEATASLAIVLTVATAFAYMGTAEGIVAFYFGLKHPRELVSYLLLGLLSISAGFYLALSKDESLQRVALIVAPHAFLFGFAELRIAQYMDKHPKQRGALILCGTCELALGGALIWGSRLSNGHVTTLLGYVALLTVLQLLPLLFYKQIPELPRSEAR